MSTDAQDPIATGSPARQIAREAVAPVEGHLERSIAAQVRAYRLASGASVAEMAERVGISKAMLSKIENAQTSCSLTTLARLAAGLDVPVTALFRGVDDQREAVYVPAGHGAQIIRRGSKQGHLYELLGGLRGPHKRMEAVLVTLTEASEVFPLFQHPGTEILYMLEGEMVYGHGEARYTMRPGDALQFDGEGPHGPEELVGLPAKFLAITAYGDGSAHT
ncbi:helix-turn-helix domain-containing protein [Kineococcus rhizosphaerae]|uniref:XRE family transcriptional regulator n=1 Tax=Kineococcus rhizosphaerae TaxID=559628 RepID=A0A2T0R6E6_9ACTN|nr:XRE family transcriptional regulator [Kineococcus rhizosphaerae]PRY16727.1 XRE family transcriptional regulator [Kineococcus rhizosphaerae]